MQPAERSSGTFDYSVPSGFDGDLPFGPSEINASCGSIHFGLSESSASESLHDSQNPSLVSENNKIELSPDALLSLTEEQHEYLRAVSRDYSLELHRMAYEAAQSEKLSEERRKRIGSAIEAQRIAEQSRLDQFLLDHAADLEPLPDSVDGKDLEDVGQNCDVLIIVWQRFGTRLRKSVISTPWKQRLRNCDDPGLAILRSARRRYDGTYITETAWPIYCASERCIWSILLQTEDL
jgi:hypothetical protein